MANINLLGQRKDIQVAQGSTIEVVFELRDQDDLVLDMTGYDLRMQVRRTIDAPGSPLINCTLANEKLAWVAQASGKFRLVLAPEDTSSLQFSKDSPDLIEGVYDMEVVSPAPALITVKPWYGSFTITREVTR